MNGAGVEPNPTKAKEWFEKSAKQENDEAQYHLGLMYEKGFGVHVDNDKAAEWYERAAAHGNEKAARALMA